MEEVFQEMVSKGEITFEEQPKFIRDRIFKLVVIEGVTKTRDGEEKSLKSDNSQTSDSADLSK